MATSREKVVQVKRTITSPVSMMAVWMTSVPLNNFNASFTNRRLASQLRIKSNSN
jgi:hypothetical protein